MSLQTRSPPELRPVKDRQGTCQEAGLRSTRGRSHRHLQPIIIIWRRMEKRWPGVRISAIANIHLEQRCGGDRRRKQNRQSAAAIDQAQGVKNLQVYFYKQGRLDRVCPMSQCPCGVHLEYNWFLWVKVLWKYSVNCNLFVIIFIVPRRKLNVKKIEPFCFNTCEKDESEYAIFLWGFMLFSL